MDNNKLKKIEQIRKRLVNEINSVPVKKRLRSLVDEHGIEAVAMAADVSTTSLTTYMNSKFPAISKFKLNMAEKVLAELTK
ncbi:hypothetical protein SIPHO054v2_p0024 [Vibrio phage 103E44.1]|nr:hypothetical protein SIPHO054v2_p0024 [Vibrio phage 103E44.1]QZI87880.1 hypothetical protein SIPHO055v2_p0024 [Vibrio phage 104E43.1]